MLINLIFLAEEASCINRNFKIWYNDKKIQIRLKIEGHLKPFEAQQVLHEPPLWIKKKRIYHNWIS